MKVVSFPGVGFHNNKAIYDNFAKYIGDNVGCESEVFFWKHAWPLPDITLPVADIRKWTYEVILDFQQVVSHSDMEVPKADYYIGHSAGSILALAQKNISCITFGSPAVLVESIHRSDNSDSNVNMKLLAAIASKRNVYNIINQYDQLAYYIDLPNVENYVYKGAWYDWNTYNPLNAHCGYWSNKDVMQLIVKTINKWEAQKTLAS